MNKDLKEMEQIYCLEIPKGISLTLAYFLDDNRLICLPDTKLIELFDKETLQEQLKTFCINQIVLNGIIIEPDLTFTVFDVKLDKDWITVPLANEMAKFLKFNFVPYSIITPKEAKFQTGVILKPIQECIDEDGNRIIEEVKG